MLFLKIAALISGIFGLMFLFTPKMLMKLNGAVNRVLLDFDSMLYRRRIGIGISLCLISLILLFAISYIVQKSGIR